ncbi:RNA helicase [Salvia divinorum]|uniref:RNA helicase n=1 Tax=Salvia divinorum TaxID=28513 RepID=A0ABD1FIE5_SALDI
MAGVRYAPEDPSLPKPWKGLVDGGTGNLYFWNPVTNVTQYERPVASPVVSAVVASDVLGSSAQKDPQCRGYHDEGGNNNAGSAKSASEPGVDQSARNSRSDHTPSDQNVAKSEVHKPIESKGAETGLSVEAYCRRHEITVTGGNVPPPFISFQSTGFPSEILREAQQAGFSAPTPIQAQSWPIAIQGRDIVAIAKTGSGKTLGYLIPGFIHLKEKRNNPKLGPTILVLSPTRELATQIQDEAVKFGKSSRISGTCLYEGAPKGPQIKDLDRGVDIVVATPGRLNDLLEMKRVYLHQISYLVLDEADRMLDMGFEPQIRKIVKEVPPRRQTLMYTATWPKEVRKIAADLLANPVQVNIGNSDELVANKSITQLIEVISQMDKRRRLEQILRQFGAAAIHGDKCQGERDHVLNEFRTGKAPVLVATDVAARGLDVKDIRVVVNYDFPTGVEDYVHRIGRTGRAGATGEAYTFFGDQDARHASDLVKILEGANQNVPAELREMASRGGGMGRGRRQWGSGSSGRDVGFSGCNDSSYGGRNDSSYGGRGSGGRGGWGTPSSPDRQDKYGSGSFGHDSNATGSFPQKSFHERMMAASNNRDRNRSRSPDRNSEWANNNSSAGKFDGAATNQRSFHETMMAAAQSIKSEAAAMQSGNGLDHGHNTDCKEDGTATQYNDAPTEPLREDGTSFNA